MLRYRCSCVFHQVTIVSGFVGQLLRSEDGEMVLHKTSFLSEEIHRVSSTSARKPKLVVRTSEATRVSTFYNHTILCSTCANDDSAKHHYKSVSYNSDIKSRVSSVTLAYIARRYSVFCFLVSATSSAVPVSTVLGFSSINLPCSSSITSSPRVSGVE